MEFNVCFVHESASFLVDDEKSWRKDSSAESCVVTRNLVTEATYGGCHVPKVSADILSHPDAITGIPVWRREGSQLQSDELLLHFWIVAKTASCQDYSLLHVHGQFAIRR